MRRAVAQSPRPLTAARVLRVWSDLLDCRARLKADALDDEHASRGRRAGPTTAQRALIEFDIDLARIASALRGWRTLASIERKSRVAAPLRERSSTDMSADVVASQKLAVRAWYTREVSAGAEPLVERLLAP